MLTNNVTLSGTRRWSGSAKQSTCATRETPIYLWMSWKTKTIKSIQVYHSSHTAFFMNCNGTGRCVVNGYSLAVNTVGQRGRSRCSRRQQCSRTWLIKDFWILLETWKTQSMFQVFFLSQLTGTSWHRSQGVCQVWIQISHRNQEETWFQGFQDFVFTRRWKPGIEIKKV